MMTDYACRECGGPTDWTTELVEVFSENAVVCDTCCENHHEAQRKEFNRPGPPTMRLDQLIKPLYLETKFDKLPKVAKANWNIICDWKPDGGTGLDFLGHCRQGKSRLMMMLLKQLHKDGHHIKIFYAGDFSTELINAKQSKHYHSWRNDIITMPILAIDDLFSEKLTETLEKALFELLNQRMERHLPIMVTRQVSKDQALNLFGDRERGISFFERLSETTQTILFNREKQKDLKLEENTKR